MAIFLIALSALALYIFQKIIYSHFWDANLEIELDFSEKSTFEGGRLSLDETLTNRKILPLPWLAVKFQVSRNLNFDDIQNAVITDDYYRNDLFSIIMFKKMKRKYPFIATKRGYYTVKALDIAAADIFISSRYAGHMDCDAYLYVYPKLLSINELLVPYQKMQGEILTRRYMVEDPFELRGVREYQVYDSMKSINWQATAKTGELKVNVHDYTSSQEIIIFLNMEQNQDWLDDTVQEDCIRVAASLSSYYIADGVPVGLVSNSIDILTEDNIDLQSGSSQDHLVTIYEALARIDITKKPTSFYEPIQRKVSIQEKEPLWIIISNEYTQKMRETYMDLLEKNYMVQWIVPVPVQDKDLFMKDVNMDNVFVRQVSLDV